MDSVSVFIFGSCVSRDFIEITDAKNIKLVDYYARSSFASIGGEPIEDDNLLERIDSNWQRAMVARDLGKDIFHSISKNNYDILLIDLIDERFNLARVDGSFCTVSTEYKKYQDSSRYKIVPFDSDEKFELWKEGFRNFIGRLEKVDAIKKIRVSRVFWSEAIEGGDHFVEPNISYIKRNNEMLRKMYSYMSSFINVNQFIDYPENILVSASTHKWGVEPFHYVNELYHYTKKSLEVSIVKCNGKPTSSLSAGKVFPDLFSAYKSVRVGEFFVNKNGVMYPFKWDMSAGQNCPLVFFTPGRTIRGKPVPIFQRSSYFHYLTDYNCVSCFDPTLFSDSEINLAWFQGDRKRFYALELAEIWKEFVDKLKLDTEKILYYGSSGGGIPGFFLAKGTPSSTLFMSNVQTDVRDYDPRTLEKLVQVSFGGDSKYVEMAGESKNRFSINGHSGAFNLIYSQNKNDVFHFERHYKKWRTETDLSFFKSVRFIEYNDPKTGHGPLDLQSEIKIIRGILEGDEYSDVFPEVEVEDIEFN